MNRLSDRLPAWGRVRLAPLAVLGIMLTVGLGFGTIGIVQTVAADGCGPYGEDCVGSITVTPASGLVDRQMVSVSGTGFAPSTTFGVAQCDPAAGPDAGIDACDLATSVVTTTDENGDVTVEMPVRRIILVQGAELDCALEACVIGAATLSGTTPIEAATAPIAFDPSVPPVPRLTVAVTVSQVGADSMSGTITCNREADAFIDSYVLQVRGQREAFAYGYSAEPISCGPTARDWTVSFFYGSTRFTGGRVTYDLFASAYDGFESADTTVSGEALLKGGGRRIVAPGDQPGETVSLAILGSRRSGAGLAIDLQITCGRAVPFAGASVMVTQWAGLEQVAGYGFVDLGGCDGVVEVSVPVTGFSGTLAGGPAEVRAEVQVFDEGAPGDPPFFDFASARRAVRLQGAIRPAPLVVEPNPGSRITITGATRGQVTGTVVCDQPAMVDMSADIQQRNGRTASFGYGYALLECVGTTTFSIPLEGDLGVGDGAVTVWALAFRQIGPEDYEYLWDDHQAAMVRVRS